jgi:hypothetical protein
MWLKSTERIPELMTDAAGEDETVCDVPAGTGDIAG